MKKFTTSLWQHCIIALLCVSMITMSACTVDQVLSDIDVALQASQSIIVAVGTISPADAAVVSALTSIAITGLQVIQKDYDDYKASNSTTTLQKISEAIQVLQANLQQNLAAAHISDANTMAKVTAWVNLVSITLVAVSATINASKNPTKMSAVALPTPESLHTRWVNEVCNGDKACSKLVKVHKKH